MFVASRRSQRNKALRVSPGGNQVDGLPPASSLLVFIMSVAVDVRVLCQRRSFALLVVIDLAGKSSGLGHRQITINFSGIFGFSEKSALIVV